MAARTSSPRLEARAGPVAIEDAVRAALADARPSLDEILSLWPRNRRDRVVLWAKLGPAGEISLGAQLREHLVDGARSDLLREAQRIRDDVPVVIELDAGDALVVPLRALQESGGRRTR